jgi:hypothetical protein
MKICAHAREPASQKMLVREIMFEKEITLLLIQSYLKSMQLLFNSSLIQVFETLGKHDGSMIDSSKQYRQKHAKLTVAS